MAADCGVWWSRAGVVAVVAVIAWERPGWVLSFVSLFFAVAVAHLAGWRGKELRTVALTVAVCAAAVDYLSWRLTVVSLSSWFVALPLFLAETHAALHTVGLHASLWPRKPEALRRDVNPTLFPVFVFVPTVDEGPAIVRETLLGILAARRHYLQRYPHASVRIIVCNDGGVANADCSHDVIRVCRSLRVECITRTVGGGAKAGNFENARRLVGATGDALLVIFDADQIPREDFFLATIAPFRDSTVGWVQTGQFYRNRANPVARWADDQQSLFYRLICPAKATHDAAFICGTNVVLRARALDEIGGLPTDSVTEDFAASIMLAPRWRSVYLSGVYATGLGPIDIRSYLRQQERWARGTLTVLRLHWRDILLPRRGGMRISQRVQYALACTHYLSGPRDLVFLVAPVLFVFTGISGVHGATLGQFLQHFVPFYLLTLAAFWHAARTTTSWRAVVIGFASFPALLKATWMTAAGRRGIFTLTPKKRRDTISARRNAVPYLAAILLCGLALAAAVTIRRSPEVWLAAFWLAYLCLMLFATLALIRADTRFARLESVAPDSLPVITRRSTARPIIRSEHSGRLPSRRPRHRAAGTRSGRLAVAAAVPALITVAALVTLGSFGLAFTKPAASAVVGFPEAMPAHTRVGISGATDAQTADLKRQLHIDQATEGRTFEIDDTADIDWVRHATADGAIPWLTLVFTRGGKDDLGTSLTAIRNGVHDASLSRWARSLADIGQPVYLTVFPQVDRNYSPTSAVAHGGIPQDVAPAWAHIRDIFAAANATNVAWVWSPGDPGHDSQYAPPPSQVNAVALTLFEYPGAVWTSPASALASAAQQHPGKPLLVEISTAGRPVPVVGWFGRPAPDPSQANPMGVTGAPSLSASRAEWLDELAAAVTSRDDVAAVVYHNDGPFRDPADPSAQSWGAGVDGASLAAAQAAFHILQTGGQ